tara:strand:- start:19405 stop:20286 length:882 start_codon:yes stop_codon:yes gene_type:complete
MADSSFKFSDEQIDRMRKCMGKIFDQYEQKYGGRKKAQDYLLSEVDKLLFKLSNNERSSIPEGFQGIRSVGTSPETFRRFADRDGDNTTSSTFNNDNSRMAIAIYLTHPTTQSKWEVVVTREELGLAAFDDHVPLVLSTYFNSKPTSDVFNELSFVGTYVGEMKEDYAAQVAELHVVRRLNGTVFSAVLSKKSETPGVEATTYEGWIIVTEGEGLLFLAKNSKKRTKHYFMSIAVHYPDKDLVSIRSVVLAHVTKPAGIPIPASADWSLEQLSTHIQTSSLLDELYLVKLLRV